MVIAEEPGGPAGWVVELMERLSGPGAALAVALDNVFPPVPSEVILPLAGFAASRGDMVLIAAIGWTTLGSVAGALLLYVLGGWFGRARVEHYTDVLEKLVIVLVVLAAAVFIINRLCRRQT